VFKGFNKLLENNIGGMANVAPMSALSSGHSKARRPPKRQFDESDRLFSLSSVTSPVSLNLDLRNDTLNEHNSNAQNGFQKV
jgi:hypothetical protein